MKEVGIDSDQIEKCVKNSFILPEDSHSENILLERDRLNANELGVHVTPALAINNHRYMGEMNGDAIFQSICSAFRVNNTPAVCTDQYDI